MATFTADMAALDDQQVDAGQQTDVQDEQPSSGDAEDGGEQQQQEQQPVDGRRGPANIRDAVREAKAALPARSKDIETLAQGHYRYQEYAKVFPKVEEAQAAKQIIDGVGGLDGITAIQQRQQQYDTQDAGLKAGDPAVLDAAFKDFPEGMATLAPHYLEQLGRTNPNALATTIAPYAMGMLTNAGIVQHIAQMTSETDPARLKSMAAQAQEWFKSQTESLKNIKQQNPQNPMDAKLMEQQTALQQQQEEFFGKQVDAAVNTASAGDLSKVVDQYAKTYKLNDIQKARFGTSLATRVVQEMLADETFKKQDQIRRASKDVQKVASFRAAEFTRRLDDAAFKESQELYGATTRPAQKTGEVKPNQAKTAPGGGPLLVSRAMDTGDLDMSKDPHGYLFIANKGYRKADGMFVTWK